MTSAATDAVAAAEPSEPPDKPRGLEATATHDSVTLTWDDPQDDSITGYVILRRVRENDEGGEFSELVADTGTAATTYTDDTVAASTTYTYRIKATNAAGTSERSRWFHIDIPAAPVPDKPTGLSATATHDQVTLTWDDPGDDSITGYVILRRHPLRRPQGPLRRAGGGHGDGGHHLHRRYGGRWDFLHLPDQGHQRGRSGRALPLVPHRHSGGPVAGIKGLCRRGAICARDGRMLSDELVITVGGPGDRPVPGCRPALSGQQKSPNTWAGRRGRSALRPLPPAAWPEAVSPAPCPPRNPRRQGYVFYFETAARIACSDAPKCLLPGPFPAPRGGGTVRPAGNPRGRNTRYEAHTSPAPQGEDQPGRGVGAAGPVWPMRQAMTSQTNPHG